MAHKNNKASAQNTLVNWHIWANKRRLWYLFCELLKTSITFLVASFLLKKSPSPTLDITASDRMRPSSRTSMACDDGLARWRKRTLLFSLQTLCVVFFWVQPANIATIWICFTFGYHVKNMLHTTMFVFISTHWALYDNWWRRHVPKRRKN